MKFSTRKYAQLLYELVADLPASKIDEEVKKFAIFLRRNRAWKLHRKIVQEFVLLSDDMAGVVRAKITTNKPLAASAEKEVEKILSHIKGGEKVELDWKTDETLLGGFILEVKDVLVDGSVSGKLNRLKSHLQN